MASRVYTPADLRDPSALWRSLRLFIILTMPLAAISGLYEAAEIMLGAGFAAENLLISLVMLVISLGSIVVFVTCVVLTCKLTYRLMRNLHAWQAPVELTSPPLSVGWYFIPIASLWMPFTAMKQMQKGADALLNDLPSAESQNTGLWWWTWIISNIAGNLSIRFMMMSGGYGEAPTDLHLYRLSNITGVLNALFLVICCPLMIDVFAKLVNAQVRIEAQRPTTPAP